MKWHQSSEHCSVVAVQCPSCHHANELTWPRYARAPFGRHTCEKCGQRFKLKATVAYFLTLLVVSGLCGVVAYVVGIDVAFASGELTGDIVSMLVFVFLMVAVVLPMDRWHDARKRTVPI